MAYDKWEYRRLDGFLFVPKGKEAKYVLLETLNEIGNDGWEVITLTFRKCKMSGEPALEVEGWAKRKKEASPELVRVRS